MRPWKMAFFLPALLMLQSCSSVDDTPDAAQEIAPEKSVRLMPMANQDGTIDYTWKNLLPAYMFYSGAFDFAAHVKGFIASFHPAEWAQLNDDPSEIDSVKGRYIREMQHLSAGYDPAATYVVRVPVYYADYDPEREAFPLKSKIKGGTELSITERVVSARASDTPELSVRDVDPYPGRFNVSFSADPQQGFPLSGIPLPQDETREVMQSRNTSRGYNRQAIAKIEFRILGLKLGEELPRFEARITDIRYEI